MGQPTPLPLLGALQTLLVALVRGWGVEMPKGMSWGRPSETWNCLGVRAPTVRQ